MTAGTWLPRSRRGGDGSRHRLTRSDRRPLGVAGAIAGRTRESGFRSAFAVPIDRRRRRLRLMCVATTGRTALPEATEGRLSVFIEIVSITISTAESCDRLRTLAEEQVSLRRVATLVAEGATMAGLFAVSQEIVHVVDVSANLRGPLRAGPLGDGDRIPERP
jgi:hypothetical protein